MPAAFMSLEDLGLKPTHRGKVRETVDLGDRLFIVTTDRISAFDCVLPQGLPGKGILLNQLSAFWFRGLSRVWPTHFISTDDADLGQRFASHQDVLRGRWMLVHKAERINVECVVRGYLAGSGWSEYQSQGSIAGHALPAGLREFDRLPQPIFTPSTKEEEGHDRPITLAETAELLGDGLARELERLSLEIYRRGAAYALSRGVILADTKFEFGHINGELSLIDEVMTPDSSRFWPVASMAGGSLPAAWDKQFVRDYLKTLDWDRTPPAPPLPLEIATRALDLYRMAYDTLTAGAREPAWAEG
jgi:phosphoribosylaminoimidazole-succinocarboxamide synthase